MTISQTDSRPQKNEGEGGSALLIVFLFAAMVAIALYMELPIVVMEAQRQQEQTLIDRGAGYQRAIQVYYRAQHTYPPTIDALVNTNNQRFLRRRYKDPLTGKDDWRILHMGPAGLADSLVNPVTGNGQGTNSPGGFGQNATGQDGFGQNGTGTGQQTGFGQSGTGLQNGFGQGANSGTAANSTQAGNVAHDPSQVGQNGGVADAQTARRRRPAAVSSSAQGTGNEPADPNAPVNPNDAPANEPTQGGDTSALGVPNGQTQPGQANGQNAVGSNANLANQIMRNPATSPAAPTSGQGTFNSAPNQNPISGGSIAGVATKVHGKAIKVFNDQTDYAKWEFVYDFRKDTSTVSGTNPQGAGGTVPLNPNQNTSSGQNSSFGQSSSFGQRNSSFGQTNNQTPANQNQAPATSNPNQ